MGRTLTKYQVLTRGGVDGQCMILTDQMTATVKQIARLTIESSFNFDEAIIQSPPAQALINQTTTQVETAAKILCLPVDVSWLAIKTSIQVKGTTIVNVFYTSDTKKIIQCASPLRQKTS